MPVPGYRLTPAHHSNPYANNWCACLVPPSGKFIQIPSHRLAKAHFHCSDLHATFTLFFQNFSVTFFFRGATAPLA